MVLSCVATAVWLCGSSTAVNALWAISKSECTDPMLCTHCFPVDDSKASANCLQLWPVCVAVWGWYGAHQASVATLLTRSPIASVSAGKSRTLATVASFGLKPAWDACFHMVLKSGGIGALVKSCAPLLLKLAIMLL